MFADVVGVKVVGGAGVAQRSRDGSGSEMNDLKPFSWM